MMENMFRQFSEHAKIRPDSAVDFREIFVSELIALALKQVLGSDVESIYVEEFASTLSREDLYNILVVEFMEGAIEVDWRDFFQYLKWIPNKSVEMKIQKVDLGRKYVMKALINEQKKRLASRKVLTGYPNVPEAVYMQHLMGIDGMIVDFVQEITESVADMMKPSKIGEEEGLTEGIGKNSKPQFSQQEISFLYNIALTKKRWVLIPFGEH